ncbi:MAG TPA: amino acid adenylation domain-containing protein, partial [Candidatus Wallbacteria bacterium]|nr:amino acid adenylation domain-containing protein [Candidatus Wallbacteria bacterium]
MNNDNRTYYELSHPEKRLFYLQKYYPETPMWNVPLSVVFKEPVNITTLKKAINLFIRNNQNMRIRFTETEAGPKQYIAEFVEKDLSIVEFIGTAAMENMHEWAENESRRPFVDLTGVELFRVFIIRLDNEGGGFYLNGHHMICDGTSLAFATDRIVEYYEELKAGKTDITEQFPSYFNYLEGEARYLKSAEFEKDREYWLSKYKNDVEQLELRPGIDNEDLKTSRSYHRAPAGISAKIYDYCGKNKISVFKFFMCSLYAYFFRLTQKEDIVILTASHGRNEEFKRSTGMFVNSLPMRLNFSSDITFRALCDKFTAEFTEMLTHQKFPSDLLASELRSRNRDPQNLFTLALSQHVKSKNGDKIETKNYGSGESFSLLTFYLSFDHNKKDEIEFFIDYRTSVYQQREINYMADHIYKLMAAAMDAPDKKISGYDFISDIEKRRLLNEFNDTDAYYPKDKTFVDIFDEQAEKMPDKKAVVYLDKFITYGQLRGKSEMLAQKLRSLGISRDDIAGIFVDRSIEMFIGAVGVLKSGGAFMPIDTKYPMDRIEFMLEDSKSKVLITQKHLLDKIKFNGTVIDLDDRSLYENEGGEFKNISRPEDLAYVIYTSGSTGKPKGTLIEHRSLLNFAFWYKNSRRITETDSIAKHASFGFDASIAEVFPPLIAGAEIHVISEDIKLSLGELNDYFEKNNIRGAFLTTQFAEQFSENIDNKSLRYLDTGGEKLRTFTKRGYDFNNCYGPTECTVYTTFFQVDRMHANIPIGRPLANTKVYITDRLGNLMPEGYPGELCVSGVCLSRGYLNRPEVTAEKFVKNPFAPGERLYKTGDLTRWLPDGNIEYIGRIDNQVKLRGFRIELGEIEMEIMKIKGIKNTAVTVVSDGDNKYICAYIVADGEITPDFIKKEISQNLPEFMIPNYIVRLDEMPVNASGKIDRKALPAPHVKSEARSEFVAPCCGTEEKLASLWKETLSLDNISALDNFFKIGGHSLKTVILQAKIERNFNLRLSIKKIFDLPSLRQMAAYIDSATCAKGSTAAIQAEPAAISSPAVNGEKSVMRGAGCANYVNPENDVEERLVKIWEEVLNLKGVGALDNFFAIGGHSIKVVSMQYKIEKEFGTRVEIKKIFGSPTIREMASLIMKAGSVKADDSKREEKSPKKAGASKPLENYPVSSVQKRLFIVENMEDGSSTSYNIPFALKIIGKLDKLKFSESIQKMVDRHEALRTSFNVVDGELVQTIHESVRLKKIYQDAGGGPLDSCIKSFVIPFDLTKAPLMRVKLLRISDCEHLLLADFHHIIFDGMSLDIFMRELFEIYNGRALPELKEQYKDFCVWQKKFIASNSNAAQEKVWFEMLSGELPTLDMPTDFPRPQTPDIKGSHIGFMADSELSARLRSLAQKTNNTLYTVILAALNILLSRYSGQEDIIVGTPLLGRPSIESQQMLGMFVNTMPARNYPKPDKKFIEFLEEVRQNFFNIIDNQDYQLDMLIDKLNVKRTNGRNPLFDVVFVYQTSQGIMETAYNDIMIKPHAIETGTAKFDITLQAFESSDSIRFDLEYRERLFKDDSIKRMSSHLINILEEVTRNPELMLKEIDLIAGEELKTVLYDFNDTAMDYPRDKTFADIFDEQAEKTPDKKAVVYLDKSITYGQLRKKGEMLAEKLRSLGISRDDIAGIFVDRSLEMFIGAVGVLKSGAAFMPIDTKYPLDRIEFMLEDSKSKVLITQKHLLDKIKFGGTVIDLEDESLYQNEAVSFKNISQPQDLAYVIYTSGSTGKPKGTLIEHHSLLNFSFWYKKTHQLTEADSLAKHASFGFDASIMEVFPPLISGSAIHVISEDIKLSLVDLNEYFEKNNIRGGFLTTQFAEQFNENIDNKSLRYLDAGGEKLRTYIKRGYDFYNGYGPTECTVYTTFFRVDKNYPNIPIGKPLANTRIYVLAKNNKLQPIGVPGELCVAGDCLARGYLGRPDLTAEKFPADPFYPGERMYRTGDLVKWLPDGNIEFLGRIDFQVKIRGFRVELGEIEIALQKHEDIEKAIVLAKEDEQENKYLCAFFTAEKDIPDQQLKEFLAKSLANYMVPSRFIRLGEMPVNASGKIDRKAVGNLEVKAAGTEELILASNEREEKMSISPFMANLQM